MNERLAEEEILKKEKIGYLKSKLNLLNGTLYLTPNRLILNAHKTGVSGLGILGIFLKRQVEKKNFGFNLEFSKIKEISQGKHGSQKNVLEVTTRQNEIFRIIVKRYEDWESDLNKRI
ncbi:GRAM domain-containing protein [Winogradskyella flava]|uniref:GRAM domain-containing protein n=1 Tax=Winogradskyella flava TaxID=1884876 RepID=UPI00249236A4|nr:GRAM domain-containing protein [Winogradskyella flava]